MPRKKEILTNEVSFAVPPVSGGVIVAMTENERRMLQFITPVPDGDIGDSEDRHFMNWLDGIQT